MPNDPQSPDLQPGQLHGQSPSPGQNPATATIPSPSTPPSLPSARGSQASLADTEELVAKKRSLVDALDQIVEPLDEILKLMRNAWRGGVILLAFMALMVGVQVHTTLRMAAVEERLDDVIAAQKTLQQTATQVAARQTETEATQSQITLVPSVSPDGSPTAIVVVKPPPAASAIPPVPLAAIPAAPPSSAKVAPRASSSAPLAPSPIKFEQW